MSPWPRLADAVLQQAAWWGAVLAAAHGAPGPAALAGGAVVAIHLLLRPTERRWVAIASTGAAVLGLAGDTALGLAGLIHFAGGGAVGPAWMVGLWAAFGAALTASWRGPAAWPAGRLALIAAVVGPIAYRAGASLGAITLPRGDLPALLGIALEWAIAVPLAALWSRAAAVPGTNAAPGASPPGGRRFRWAR